MSTLPSATYSYWNRNNVNIYNVKAISNLTGLEFVRNSQLSLEPDPEQICVWKSRC